jgi:hypothetical protein
MMKKLIAVFVVVSTLLLSCFPVLAGDIPEALSYEDDAKVFIGTLVDVTDENPYRVTVFPVLVGVASVEIKSVRIGKIAAVLGATSMGVYLLHPLVTRGLSVVITRQIAAPYSASVVVGEWVVAWGISMVAAVLMLRLPGLRRFV